MSKMKSLLGVSMMMASMAGLGMDYRYGPGDSSSKMRDSSYKPKPRLTEQERKMEFSIELFNLNDKTMLLPKRELFVVRGYRIAALNQKNAVKTLNSLRRKWELE